MIINLTQHPATTAQIEAGVVDLDAQSLAHAKKWLTFESLPTQEEIEDAAGILATIAHDFAVENDCEGCEVMIGGAPFLMSALESALKGEFLTPVYAFSKRVSIEATQSDGSVRKENVFMHEGFVRI